MCNRDYVRYVRLKFIATESDVCPYRIYAAYKDGYICFNLLV